jgi:hypothetical protein
MIFKKLASSNVATVHAVEATLDGEGLTAVSNWADDYGGGLIQYQGHVALDLWANDTTTSTR